MWLPDEDDKLLPHRVEDAPGRRGEKLYIAAGELLHEVALSTESAVSRWGDFDLPSLPNEQVAALDRPLDEIAKKFTTVEVPRNDLGWRRHPWLGFIKNR